MNIKKQILNFKCMICKQKSIDNFVMGGVTYDYCGYEYCKKRKKNNTLTLVDKANVLTYAHDLWRRVFVEVGEKYSDIKKEYYVGAVIGREEACPILICSPEGGVEIEEVAAKTPEKILKAIKGKGLFPDKSA